MTRPVVGQAAPAVSVIIPAFNAQSTLGECLRALAVQTYPSGCYEIILVDDGSSDGTPQIAQAFQGVQVLHQSNSGPAAARNMGAQHARGDLLLFTDADCAPAPDWVETMASAFQDPAIAGVKGAYLTRQASLVARFVQSEYEDKYERMQKFPYIDFIDTYSAGYRRQVFLENQGFDVSYTTSSVEDQEFSFRLAAQGHKMLFVPAGRVYHMGHARSVGEYFKKKYKIGYWKVRVHQRHPGKLLHDSHTPPELKLQILALALGLVSLAAGLLFPPAALLGILALLFFITTSLSFIRTAWKKDPPVALISPVLLLVRAAALGLGFFVGLASALLLSKGARA